MLAITCDLCGNPIIDKARLIDVIEAKMVMSFGARPRVTERGSITSVEACDLCGRRVLKFMQHLRTQQVFHANDAASAGG